MMDQREDTLSRSTQQRHPQQQPWRSDDHDESLSLAISSSSSEDTCISVVADDDNAPLLREPCIKRISVPPAYKAHGYASILLRVVAIGAIVGILIVRREGYFRGTLRTTKAAPGYVRPNKLFGYVHIAKAGGTNLNSLFANVFERVCGNKGYSFESYRENEVAKRLGNGYPVERFNEHWSDDDRPLSFSGEQGAPFSFGLEDCDYVANEVNYKFWIQNFGNASFHGVPMELHVPCRDRIDHVMSQCNYRSYSLDCAITSDEDFFRTIEENCFTFVHQRYQHELKDHFDVKCFDVKKQFTTYAGHMSQHLERKRFQSVPFIPRLSNRPRNRTKECIWSRPDLREKLEKYLSENVPYYQFCEDCMGTDNDLTSTTRGGVRKGGIGEGKAGEDESIFTWKKEGLGEAPTSKFHNLYWNQLPAEAKEKAELLGYLEKTWNSDADIPIYDRMLNLSPEEMEAMQYLGVFMKD